MSSRKRVVKLTYKQANDLLDFIYKSRYLSSRAKEITVSMEMQLSKVTDGIDRTD